MDKNYLYLIRVKKGFIKIYFQEKSGDLNFRISMEEIQAKMGTLIVSNQLIYIYLYFSF